MTCLAVLDQLGVGWSITSPLRSYVRNQHIAAIDQDSWKPIYYPGVGRAQVAETTSMLKACPTMSF